MKNILKKSLFIVLGCLMSLGVSAEIVALAPGTYSLSSAPATSGSKKFNTYQNIYYGRNGGGLAGNNGVEVKSGSMIAFKISASSTIKFKVRNSKTKSITDTWSVKAISDADFAGIVAQCTAGTNASTYYSNNNSELASITITQTGVATAYTNETSALQPGCYGFYLSTHSADGDFIEEIVIAGTAPVVSTDATLKGLTYNGTSVPNFSASQEHYDVELPAGTTQVPTVAATANESHATAVVTQATAIPGTASVTVTAEDGTTTKTYSITFTVASAYPKVQTATWPNIQGTAVIDNVNNTISGQVKNGTGLTSITPTFTGTNISSWQTTTGQTANIDFTQPVEIIFSAATGHITSYLVTITEADPQSSDATLKSLTYGGKSVPNFSPSTYVYNIELTAGIKTPPTIGAVANDSKAQVAITQAQSVPGSGNVVVTAEDGTTLTYTVNYTVAVPQSTLTTHKPEVYEAKEIAGGYGGQLAVYNGREYETYYASFLESGALSVTVTPVQKSAGITTSISDYHCKATDGWFEMETTTSKSNYTMSATDEFAAGSSAIHKLLNNASYELHVQGFDQFSFYGKDNNADASKGKHFEVYVDNIQQPMTLASSATIRRFDITTGEHIIKVVGVGASNNEFYGFSLRVAQEPRTRWLKGNDSTQVVMQTSSIKPVHYFTKYNNLGETRLEWDGPAATGITLSNQAQGPLGDTLVLSGVANCPVGVYNYHVASYYNGTETSRVNGSFKVASDIKALSDIIVNVYQGEEMDQISFKYYALTESDILLTWTNGAPAGVSGSVVNGRYVIGGTPTTLGSYPYDITVTGADTVIHGQITVLELNYGTNPVLYLYKNNSAWEKDGVYTYVQSKWNLINRKAKEDGLRPAEQYARYKWILISEDVDADNAEVIQVIRGGANLPVLNLKGFTYASERLGWGEPNNGAVDSAATKLKGCYLHVQNAAHPVFPSAHNSINDGDSLRILSTYEQNGLMPISVHLQGSLCLGTAYTRDINNYYGAGELQTALHEVPADMRGGYKYICMPMARNVKLTNMGEQLMDGIIAYLTSPNASGIEAPTLEIRSFKVGEYNATISQRDNTITLSIPQEEYDNLENAQPVIELANPNSTHVTPSVEPSIDLRYAAYIPHTFVVTDYINRRAYSFSVEVYDPQGIENVYEAGMWVNVYDIYGRKVTTTNENIYTMELPQGIYIIVMEDGQTLKIMR